MIKRLASMTTVLGLLTLVISTWPGTSAAQGRVFHVRADGGSRVSFTSDAPLETITGLSSNVSGRVTIDPRNLAATRGVIEVPVASLRTGNDLRDEHLRSDNWLDASLQPNARFEITGVSGASALEPNQETQLQIRGNFSIHGVTKPVTAQVRVRWIPLTEELRGTPGITGDVLRVRARFQLQLEDFDVSVPAIVRLKVSNTILVTVNLRAVPGRQLHHGVGL